MLIGSYSQQNLKSRISEVLSGLEVPMTSKRSQELLSKTTMPIVSMYFFDALLLENLNHGISNAKMLIVMLLMIEKQKQQREIATKSRPVI